MKPKETELPHSDKDTRRVLRKFLRKIDKLISGPQLLLIVGGLIDDLLVLEDLLKRERRRKRPSKAFRTIRQLILNACEGQLGPFAKLEPRLIVTLDQFLDGMLKSLKKPPAAPAVDPADFLRLQKKLLVTPKKRGPKLEQIYDTAYRRARKGETVRSIAQELQPDHYQADPEGTLRKFQQAIQRRKPVPKRP